MKSKFIALLTLILAAQILAGQQEHEEIASLIDSWHLAAAGAEFDQYFDKMTEDAVFIGTDATENWAMQAFKDFSRPYFERGKAWDFTAVERNIYVDDSGKLAWFDELLDTWMGICRGSGVVKLQDGQWKIAHYVLSATVPNDQMDQLIKLKKEMDSLQLMEIRSIKQNND